MSEGPISERYLSAVGSFIELARSLRDADWAVPVPCTPAWTVRDVLSHVSGIPDDALAGRLDGVTTEPWTAAQVERNAGADVPTLLLRWEEQAPVFAAALDELGQGRPPIDCHAHEHDVRHALGRPGNRDSVVIEESWRDFATLDDLPVSLVVELTDGRNVASGSGERRVTLQATTPFEIFRSRLGRRSRQQVLGYDWSGDRRDVEEVVAHWFAFGPSATPIDEASDSGRVG